MSTIKCNFNATKTKPYSFWKKRKYRSKIFGTSLSKVINRYIQVYSTTYSKICSKEQNLFNK